MRPDIDNADEYVRNTTARVAGRFCAGHSSAGAVPESSVQRAVVASLHTGAKIVQQIAIMMGCAILPHLNELVACLAMALADDHQKVRTMAALAVAALAEAAHPYGIESFDDVLKPLWKGVKRHRNKVLAAFLKAIGFIIPLMDADHAPHYTDAVMGVLVREFASPDEAMKRVVMIVVKQCVSTEGVQSTYIRETILEPFFRNLWIRRTSMDKRLHKLLVDTTVALGAKWAAKSRSHRLEAEG